MKKEKQYIGETFTTTGREKYWAKRFTDAICPPMPINNKPTKVMKKKIIKKSK